MVEVKKVFALISKAALGLMVADVMILMFTMLSIAQGQAVQHVPFWDAQLRFIINLIS